MVAENEKVLRKLTQKIVVDVVPFIQTCKCSSFASLYQTTKNRNWGHQGKDELGRMLGKVEFQIQGYKKVISQLNDRT